MNTEATFQIGIKKMKHNLFMFARKGGNDFFLLCVHFFKKKEFIVSDLQ